MVACTTQTFKAGTVFYRAENADQGVGSFLGLVKPGSGSDAEALYNLSKYGNRAQVVTTYILTKDTTMYVGDVAGGSGQQALLPAEVKPADVLQRIDQEALP